MSKLEAVARAMWEARRAHNAAVFGIEVEAWGDGSLPRANGIFAEAKAALEALKPPDAAMFAAVFPAPGSLAGIVALEKAWGMMLEVAAKEEQVCEASGKSEECDE
jgi:hypothetical protein